MNELFDYYEIRILLISTLSSRRETLSNLLIVTPSAVCFTPIRKFDDDYLFIAVHQAEISMGSSMQSIYFETSFSVRIEEYLNEHTSS